MQGRWKEDIAAFAKADAPEFLVMDVHPAQNKTIEEFLRKKKFNYVCKPSDVIGVVHVTRNEQFKR